MIQSNYLPWRGYFDFIDDVDLFIFYDDVQYTRRDWRNRNKIKTRNGLAWLTVPVHFHQDDQSIQLICHSTIDYSRDWARKHLLTIKQWYGPAPFYGMYQSELLDLLTVKYPTISLLNISLCQWIMKQLDIRTPFTLSQDYAPRGEKTDRIIDILKKVGATSYLVGPAAKSYINEQMFLDAGIQLEYKSYQYGSYPQMWSGFAGEVSVLDLLLNTGPQARRHLKSLIPNVKAAPAQPGPSSR